LNRCEKCREVSCICGTYSPGFIRNNQLRPVSRQGGFSSNATRKAGFKHRDEEDDYGSAWGGMGNGNSGGYGKGNDNSEGFGDGDEFEGSGGKGGFGGGFGGKGQEFSEFDSNDWHQNGNQNQNQNSGKGQKGQGGKNSGFGRDNSNVGGKGSDNFDGSSGKKRKSRGKSASAGSPPTGVHPLAHFPDKLLVRLSSSDPALRSISSIQGLVRINGMDISCNVLHECQFSDEQIKQSLHNGGNSIIEATGQGSGV
jgi:hypothetical protein